MKRPLLREVALRLSLLALGLVLCVTANAAFSATPIKLASLAIGEPDDFREGLDEVEPRADLKTGAAKFPSLDTSRKGDPVVALRPSFETKLRGKVSQPGL